MSPDLNEQLEVLRREVQALQQRDARRRSRLLVAAVAVAVVAGTALAQPTLVPFQADTPARASALNASLEALRTYSVPTGATMFFDLAACPAGWSAATFAEGRAAIGRPSAGTLRRQVGTAMAGNTDPTHTHAMQTAGSHAHSGTTGNWVGWRQSQINYNAIPAVASPYHIVSNLEIATNGDHAHTMNAMGAGSVMPYVYLTVCRKN